MLKDFKAFVLRGNVVDLAVGIVIGAAFGALVASFVENLLRREPPVPVDRDPGVRRQQARRLPFHRRRGRLPLRASSGRHSLVRSGAAAVFFLVVRPVNALMNRHKTEPDVQSPTKQCSECLSSIPRDARRCAYCTSEQPS